ncbi:hypothetical protein ACFW1A_00960 [Kitasatospora sp. NPDC058965]|uniref:hypothetical protein n=1 Tax=Kitasatospora sp. NPDC058965 TaxID=3346682 RepID=UPI0036930B39
MSDNQSNENLAKDAIDEYLREREQFWSQLVRLGGSYADAYTSTWRGAEGMRRRWSETGRTTDSVAEMVGTKAEERVKEAFRNISAPAGPQELEQATREALAIWRGLTELGYTITQANHQG